MSMPNSGPRRPASAEEMLPPASRVPQSLDDPTPTKADAVARASRTQFGLMARGPAISAAVAALTLHYEMIDPLMGDLEVMGDRLYLTASAYHKLFQSEVPLCARRWVKRPAKESEYAEMALTPWRAVSRESNPGYVGRGSRLWYVELYIRPWTYREMPNGSGMAVPDGEWFLAGATFGEANELNCELSVSAAGAKLKGDARVLDRQAIKRAEHEILRETVSFVMRGQRTAETLDVFSAGVQISGEEPIDVESAPPIAAQSGGIPGSARAAEGQVNALMAEFRVAPRFRAACLAEAIASVDPVSVVQRYAAMSNPVPVDEVPEANRSAGGGSGGGAAASDAETATAAKPTGASAKKPGRRSTASAADKPQASESATGEQSQAAQTSPEPDLGGEESQGTLY